MTGTNRADEFVHVGDTIRKLVEDPRKLARRAVNRDTLDPHPRPLVVSHQVPNVQPQRLRNSPPRIQTPAFGATHQGTHIGLGDTQPAGQPGLCNPPVPQYLR